MSLKFYPKAFVNPLLALAFKEGVEFVNDPDYKASEPRKEGDKWVVIIQHDDDDDDDDNEPFQAQKWLSPIKIKPTQIASSRLDYEERFKSMKPVSAQSAPEIIHPPIKISAEIPAIEPCGECMSCRQGHDCLKIIGDVLISRER